MDVFGLVAGFLVAVVLIAYFVRRFGRRFAAVVCPRCRSADSAARASGVREEPIGLTVWEWRRCHGCGHEWEEIRQFFPRYRPEPF